ncbi:MAG: hypothetical protein H8E32_18090 [Nitrospinae bacterium]|nr:hypothetical protein [Nitrospinota bacterium]
MYQTNTVEDCLSLDVNFLHRQGSLRPGAAGSLKWTRNGKSVSSIGFRMKGNQLTLNYRYRSYGGEWECVEEPIHVARILCRFGGTRPYFICPSVMNGVVCGRRVVMLYAGSSYYLCRHCYRLKYSSQYENSWDRAMTRGNKIRERLGGDGGMKSKLAPRPKGMWRRTYERLCNEVRLAEAKGDRDFLDYIRRRSPSFIE